jgi:DNA replication initiation complex subunit (GINS family)
MFNAELSRINREIENIRRIIKELYEKREIKLINISLSNSITGSGHGTENVLEEEKPLYENLLELLNGFRERTLNFLLDGMVMDKPKAIKSEDFVDFNKGMKSQETLKNPFQTSDKQEEKTAENQTTDTITIRLLAAVPKFFGTDGHIYGPFESDDLAELPLEIANLLLKNNRAEKI